MNGITGVSANSGITVALDPDDPNHLWGSFGPGPKVPPGFVISESTDGGLNWAPRTSGLPDQFHKKLLFDQTDSAGHKHLLVTAGINGIYSSSDGGQSWQNSSAGLDNGEIRDLVADPSGARVYWCVRAGLSQNPAAVYRSNDHGNTWTRASGDSLQAWDINHLAISPTDPRRLYIAGRATWVAPTKFPGGIFMSADGGVTWKQILDDPYAVSVAVDPHFADVLYAGLSDDPYHDDSRGGGLKISLDSGASWTKIESLPNDRIWTITPDPVIPFRVFVGTAGNGVVVINWRRGFAHPRRQARGNAPSGCESVMREPALRGVKNGTCP